MKTLLKLYGERNTNTNYLRRLIDLNLDVCQLDGVVPKTVKNIIKVLPGDEFWRDAYFWCTYGSNLGWKHAKAKDALELTKYSLLKHSRVVFVTITKNPYSWLLSLHRNPYHQFESKNLDFESFLQMPWRPRVRDGIAHVLNSPVELWNIKNASYLQLSRIHAVNITTESLFVDPEEVIETISRSLTIRRTGIEFVNYVRSTKNEKKDFDYYQRYYLEEKWRDSLSNEAISIINEGIDTGLMKKFGYAVLPSK